MILTGTVLAACGGASSGSHVSDTSRSNADPTRLQTEALNFARCMRAHGVSSFPDPTPGGAGFNIAVAGLNPSSPAFRAAQNACHRLLPVKRAPSGPPSAAAFRRLVRWAICMRAHGISGLSDPKRDPLPPPGSADANRYGTAMGDGGYWVGIPLSVDAHSPAFMHLATVCGESPTAHHG